MASYRVHWMATHSLTPSPLLAHSHKTNIKQDRRLTLAPYSFLEHCFSQLNLTLDFIAPTSSLCSFFCASSASTLLLQPPTTLLPVSNCSISYLQYKFCLLFASIPFLPHIGCPCIFISGLLCKSFAKVGKGQSMRMASTFQAGRYGTGQNPLNKNTATDIQYLFRHTFPGTRTQLTTPGTEIEREIATGHRKQCGRRGCKDSPTRIIKIKIIIIADKPKHFTF